MCSKNVICDEVAFKISFNDSVYPPTVMLQSLVIVHLYVHIMVMLEDTTSLHGLEFHHQDVLATLSMYHLMGMHLQMLLSI
jgi:hypothetical protein